MSSAAAVVGGLAATRKALQLYPEAHPRFRGAVVSFLGAVQGVTMTGAYVLNVHHGRLYEGSNVIPDETPSIAAIAEALEAHRIESLTFHANFGETDAIALGAVLGMRPTPQFDAAGELESRGAKGVTVSVLEEDEDAEAEKRERDEQRRRDKVLYEQLVGMLRGLSSQLVGGGAPDLGATGDVVQNLLGRLMSDQAAMLGLATLRAKSEVDLFHSVNVAIYALAMGAALGLPDEGLASLGMCALLHDIGKVPFDRRDPEQAKQATYLHPEIGAQILVRIAEDDQAPMLVAYEHHMYVDGSGFPERDPDYFPHPFSRIIGIADRYETLTKPNAEGACMTPDKALMTVLRETGRKWDPLFARLLARALGVFPVGCVVRMSDQRVAVVRAPGNDPLRPQVRVLYDEGGIEYPEPIELDMAETEAQLVEVVDQDFLALEVSERL